MPEKPCEWAENPSGSVWECTAHNTQCAHKHADTNPDGSVNIFECRLGDPAYAFREIKRLQRLTKSYQETVDRLVGVLQERWKPISECWIPVTDRLPDMYERVLVTFKPDDGYEPVAIGFFYKFGGKTYFDDYSERSKLDDILAWMPLPEAYKGDTHV